MSNSDKLALAEYTIQVMGKRLNSLEGQIQQLGTIVINWMGVNKHFIDTTVRFGEKINETKTEEIAVPDLGATATGEQKLDESTPPQVALPNPSDQA